MCGENWWWVYNLFYFSFDKLAKLLIWHVDFTLTVVSCKSDASSRWSRDVGGDAVGGVVWVVAILNSSHNLTWAFQCSGQFLAVRPGHDGDGDTRRLRLPLLWSTNEVSFRSSLHVPHDVSHANHVCARCHQPKVAGQVCVCMSSHSCLVSCQ